MVTAGVYLLIRLSPIFSITPITLTLVSIIGALTAFFAASSGLVQNDVKRVIAYSTSSQLGFIPTNILFSNSFNFNNSNNNKTNHDILPINFIKKYTNITESEFYNIKTEYKNIPLIYAWYNTINGKLSVGKL
jgi:NADH:ubiquinone oxidoreductase subunit 4 (subunit M)